MLKETHVLVLNIDELITLEHCVLGRLNDLRKEIKLVKRDIRINGETRKLKNQLKAKQQELTEINQFTNKFYASTHDTAVEI